MLTTLSNIIKMPSMFHTLHKLALVKQAICKIIYQTSEPPKTLMNQVATDLVTESKWRALESAEHSDLVPQGMKE
jgi:hypothetical protein